MTTDEWIAQAAGVISTVPPMDKAHPEACVPMAQALYDAEMLGDMGQTDKLGNYLMEEYPDEITDGGAIEIAIGILKKYKGVIKKGGD